MKVVHRITLNINSEKKTALESLGFYLPCGFQTLEVEENHAEWGNLEKLIVPWGCVDIVSTKFTLTEYQSARYLKLSASWHCGYPQPEDNFAYLSETYDLKAFCKICGAGKHQKGPFKLLGEPDFGTKHILQLNWIFDAFFCKLNVFDTVFRKFNIKSSQVLDYKSGKPIESIVQLVSQGSVSCKNNIEDYREKLCSTCKRPKYLPVTKGFFPYFHMDTHLDFFHSMEEFGSGAAAYHAVFISQALYRKISHMALKGISFTPVQQN